MRRMGGRGRSRWLLLGVCVAAVFALLPRSAAVSTPTAAADTVFDVAGQIGIDTWTWSDGRCTQIEFVEVPAIKGASYTAVVYNQVAHANQTFSAGPDYFPTDSYTMSYAGGSESHTFTATSGTHRIGLGGGTGPSCSGEPRFDLVSVEATVPGKPPVARFTWEVRQDAPLTVDFDASSSHDDKEIVSYEWTFGGVSASGVKPQFTFPEPGTYEVRLKVTDDEGLSDTLAQNVSVSGRQGALVVTITPAKNPVHLGVDFPDNTFDLRVEVRNAGDVPLTGVRVQGLPEIGPIQGDEPHKNSQVVDPVPDGVIGDLAPGGTATVTYRLQALRKGISELSVLVTGWDGAQTVSANGRKQLEVKEKTLVEFRVRGTGGPYRAGQGLRLEGSVKNVSADKKIGVVAIPVPGRYSNAGNGFLHTTDVTRTPDVPQGWLLEPGQSLPLVGIVRTLRSAVGGTAEIDYVVKAWVHNDDGSLTNVDAQVEKIDEDGYGVPVRIFVSANPPEPDTPGFDCGYGWFTCGLVVGTDNLINGGIDLLRLLGTTWLNNRSYELRTLAWESQMYNTAWQAVKGNPAAKQALADEIKLDLQSMVEAGALADEQTGEMRGAIMQALSHDLDTWVTAYASGNLEELEYLSGKLVGENPDLVAEGFLKLPALVRRVGAQKLLRGLARTEKSEPVVRALEKAAAARDAEAAAAAASGLEGPQLAKKLPTGAVLGENVERRLGQGARDIAKMQEIAKKENLLLLFRARAARAWELLEQGLAWWKPEAMKIKTVNDIDVRYLGGYTRKGVVQFVEPPFKVDLSLPRSELAAAIKRDAKAFTDGLGIQDVELAREVQKRAELRASEWALYHDKFFDSAFGKGPWQQQGIEVAFDATKQGIPSADVATDLRKLQLEPIEAPGGRRAYDVRMEGPGGRDYRFITGDTDFLAILNADGTPIMDVSRRLEIYDLLQEAVGMQHGESLTYAVGAEKRAEFLRCCVEGGEAMIAIGPDGVPTAARFVESKSVLDDTLNWMFRSDGAAGDFTLLYGARQQLKANTVLWNSMTALDVFDALADAVARYRVFYSPVKLSTFVNGLQQSMQRNTFDRRNGAVLQPNGDGGLRRWTQGPGANTLSTAGARTLASSSAQATGWAEIGLAQALALGLPGTIDLLPQTVLTWSAEAGATSVGETEQSGMPGHRPISPSGRKAGVRSSSFHGPWKT